MLYATANANATANAMANATTNATANATASTGGSRGWQRCGNSTASRRFLGDVLQSTPERAEGHLRAYRCEGAFASADRGGPLQASGIPLAECLRSSKILVLRAGGLPGTASGRRIHRWTTALLRHASYFKRNPDQGALQQTQPDAGLDRPCMLNANANAVC